MERSNYDKKAYNKMLNAFRRNKSGLSIADITAKTALPLDTVHRLIPDLADEFSARLQVTESGEILYSFPHGMTSRYKGPAVLFKKILKSIGTISAKIGTWLFKAWILVMLVGYFVLFMAIALMALVASVAVSSSGSSENRSSSRRGGGLGGLYLASYIFDLVIRLWFYSEITKSVNRRGFDNFGRTAQKRPKGKPLHQAVFSFVFGDGDPNADWDSREKKAVIAYIQANKGVISLPEFIALTGFSVEEAEHAITAYCSEFKGMPEATEDGTIVYVFQELMLRTDTRDRSFQGLSAPIKRLNTFSGNSKKMNIWFLVINAVNLLFGSYFIFSSLSYGPLLNQLQFQEASRIYAVATALFMNISMNPYPILFVGLGIVPVLFAFLFYLIPGMRYLFIKNKNEQIKLQNLRKEAMRSIWNTSSSVYPDAQLSLPEEYRPKNTANAIDSIIKEIGTYSVPEIKIDDTGEAIYDFIDIKREKEAIQKYRSSIDSESSRLGASVFDTHGDTI